MVDDEVLRVTMRINIEERGASCTEGEIVDSRTSKSHNDDAFEPLAGQVLA